MHLSVGVCLCVCGTRLYLMHRTEYIRVLVMITKIHSSSFYSPAKITKHAAASFILIAHFDDK